MADTMYHMGANLPEDLQKLVDLACADAEMRTGIAADQWTMHSIMHVTWNNGSLGVAKPGEFYTQALVPGHRIVLSHKDRFVVYHTSATRVKFALEHLSGGPQRGVA